MSIGEIIGLFVTIVIGILGLFFSKVIRIRKQKNKIHFKSKKSIVSTGDIIAGNKSYYESKKDNK